MIEDWKKIRRGCVALLLVSMSFATAISNDQVFIKMFVSTLAGIAGASVWWATMCITMARKLDALTESFEQMMSEEMIDAPRIYPSQGEDRDL